MTKKDLLLYKCAIKMGELIDRKVDLIEDYIIQYNCGRKTLTNRLRVDFKGAKEWDNGKGETIAFGKVMPVKQGGTNEKMRQLAYDLRNIESEPIWELHNKAQELSKSSNLIYSSVTDTKLLSWSPLHKQLKILRNILRRSQGILSGMMPEEMYEYCIQEFDKALKDPKYVLESLDMQNNKNAMKLTKTQFKNLINEAVNDAIMKIIHPINESFQSSLIRRFVKEYGISNNMDSKLKYILDSIGNDDIDDYMIFDPDSRQNGRHITFDEERVDEWKYANERNDSDFILTLYSADDNVVLYIILSGQGYDKFIRHSELNNKRNYVMNRYNKSSPCGTVYSL